MSLEINGRLLAKYDTQQVSEKFKKREFVLEIQEEINGNIYTNYGKFQLTQAKCDILDRFNEGDKIKVSFNVKGNKYEKDGTAKYITNLDAWRIEYDGSVQQRTAQHEQHVASAPTFNPSPETIDDLPF